MVVGSSGSYPWTMPHRATSLTRPRLCRHSWLRQHTPRTLPHTLKVASRPSTTNHPSVTIPVHRMYEVIRLPPAGPTVGRRILGRLTMIHLLMQSRHQTLIAISRKHDTHYMSVKEGRVFDKYTQAPCQPSHSWVGYI